MLALYRGFSGATVLKNAAIILFLVGVLLLATIGIYQYLKVVFGPTYDAEKMSLNYEVLGAGPKQLVLIHSLNGSLNYWKHDMESISNIHSLLLIDLRDLALRSLRLLGGLGEA